MNSSIMPHLEMPMAIYVAMGRKKNGHGKNVGHGPNLKKKFPWPKFFGPWPESIYFVIHIIFNV